MDKINACVIFKVDTVYKKSLNSDSFDNTDFNQPGKVTLYALEYPNSLEFLGLPSRKICLKFALHL